MTVKALRLADIALELHHAWRAGLRLVRHGEELALLTKEPAEAESSGSVSSPVTERKG